MKRVWSAVNQGSLLARFALAKVKIGSLPKSLIARLITSRQLLEGLVDISITLIVAKIVIDTRFSSDGLDSVVGRDVKDLTLEPSCLRHAVLL